MHVRGAPTLLALTLSCSAAGCNPYERRDGEFFAGSIDPVGFPAAYLGLGGDGKMAGSGVFIPVMATAKGQDVAYYAFPLPDAQAEQEDPLDVAALAPANAYVFDPGPTSPFPAMSRCVAPARYVYNPQQDAVRLDEQGNVFTRLPDDPTYAPVVGQVPVTSAGEPCQDIKSEETLLSREDVRVPTTPPPGDVPDARPTGKPDGKLLAWAIIDPAARVLGPDDDPDDPSVVGLGIQRWGFYNHYLLAYLDGGYLPLKAVMGGAQLVPQALYYPAQVIEKDKNGMDVIVPQEHAGQGYDVLEAARGEPGYSPLCRIFQYEMTDDKGKPVLVTDVKDIDPLSVTPTGEYVYCIQAR